MERTRNLLPVGVALILVGAFGLGVVFLLGGASSLTGGGMGMGGIGMGGGMGMGRGAVDEMFIEQMIPHHDDAIAMAELALERSERSEIRQLAEDIRRSQTAENAQMLDWYRDWYGGEPDVGTRMGMGMMGGATDLRALESAPDFDKEFLEQMVPHHEMAVMMTTMVVNRGGREELRELADSMRRAQSREIELMEGWYSEWYGR
jgi:uncharacterized protein (DUF305 family)